FETDAVLNQFAAMFGGDAVEHPGGVECARDSTGPAFALEHPTEQHRKNLVGIDEFSVLVGGADAGGVAQGANVRLDRFRIDAGKKRIDVAANLHVIDADTRENVGEYGAARAIHRVDGKLHAGFRNQVEVSEAFDGLEVRGQKIDFLDLRRLCCMRYTPAKTRLNGCDNGGLPRAAVPGFVLHAIPLRWIVRRRDHDAAGGTAFAHAEAQCGRGRDVVGEHDADAGRGDNISTRARKSFGAEARVVADAESLARIFLGVDVGGNSCGGYAHIGEREIICDDRPPAVRSKLDLRIRHDRLD